MRHHTTLEITPTVGVLLLEDDDLLRAELIGLMAKASLAVRAVRLPEEAIALLGSGWQPSMVVIDLFLPTPEVLRIGRAMRSNCAVPVLVVVQGSDDGMLSGKTNSGLHVVQRPLTSAQILRRCEQMLSHRTRQMVLAVGSLNYIPGTLVCAIGRERIDLSSDEALMLERLMLQPGQVVSRGELFALMSGFHRDLDLRIVDVYLVRLMVKIGSKHGVALRLAHNRSGYILAVDGDSLTDHLMDDGSSLSA